MFDRRHKSRASLISVFWYTHSHAGNGPSLQLSPTIHTPDAAPKGPEGDVQKSPSELPEAVRAHRYCMCKLGAYLRPSDSLSLVNATVPQGDGTGNEMDDKQDRDSGDDGGYLPRGGATMRQPITLQDITPTADAHNGHVTRDTEGEGESGEPVEGPTHGGESEESGPGGRRAL